MTGADTLDQSVDQTTDDAGAVGAGRDQEHDLELLVKQMTWEADGVLSLTLVDPEGKPLPEWSPGAHLDLGLGTLVRQYSLCGDPHDTSYYRVAVLRDQAALGGSLDRLFFPEAANY